MSKITKDNLFEWKMGEWTMGRVSSKHYVIDHDGMEKFVLSISVPDKMRPDGHLLHLLTREYKSVIITPDAKQKDYLQISFTDIDIDKDDEEMTD